MSIVADVAALEVTCHAGGRGLESRRSRFLKRLQIGTSVACIGAEAGEPGGKRAAAVRRLAARPVRKHLQIREDRLLSVQLAAERRKDCPLRRRMTSGQIWRDDAHLTVRVYLALEDSVWTAGRSAWARRASARSRAKTSANANCLTK
jgi:hypothetical protein